MTHGHHSHEITWISTPEKAIQEEAAAYLCYELRVEIILAHCIKCHFQTLFTFFV